MQKENSVIFKGTKDGLTILLNPNIDFMIIKSMLEKKFKEAKKFFNGAQASIQFKGRDLTEEEQNELIQIISLKSGLNITYIFDENSKETTSIEEDLQKKEENLQENSMFTDEPTKIYRGTVRSGQRLQYDGNIVIIGDVNPGGMVIAQGNVIVLGILKGIAHAGASGDINAFIIALQLNPMQLRIADIYTRKPESIEDKLNPAENVQHMEVAYLVETKIVIEPLDKKTINNLPIV